MHPLLTTQSNKAKFTLILTCFMKKVPDFSPHCFCSKPIQERNNANHFWMDDTIFLTALQSVCVSSLCFGSVCFWGFSFWRLDLNWAIKLKTTTINRRLRCQMSHLIQGSKWISTMEVLPVCWYYGICDRLKDKSRNKVWANTELDHTRKLLSLFTLLLVQLLTLQHPITISLKRGKFFGLLICVTVGY